MSEQLSLAARLRNLADQRAADRGDETCPLEAECDDCDTVRALREAADALASSPAPATLSDPGEVLHYECPVVVNRAAEASNGKGFSYTHPVMSRLDGDLYDSLGRTLRYQCQECKAIVYVTFAPDASLVKVAR